MYTIGSSLSNSGRQICFLVYLPRLRRPFYNSLSETTYSFPDIYVENSIILSLAPTNAQQLHIGFFACIGWHHMCGLLSCRLGSLRDMPLCNICTSCHKALCIISFPIATFAAGWGRLRGCLPKACDLPPTSSGEFCWGRRLRLNTYHQVTLHTSVFSISSTLPQEQRIPSSTFYKGRASIKALGMGKWALGGWEWSSGLENRQISHIS